jgi:hypothetical protein
MYLKREGDMTTLKHAITGAARGTSSAVITTVGAVLLGFGVPLLWIWFASAAAGEQRHVTSALALFLITGILGTYWVALLVAGLIRARFFEDDSAPKVRRQSWNRSMRDEPFRPGRKRLDPIERIFIVAAILGFVAFEVWFALWSGSPLPSVGY